jgi:hypothetical protein
MKKIVVAVLALCLAFWAAPAMAEDLLDGIKSTDGTVIAIDLDGYATGAPRYFNPGEAWGNQELSITMPMSALIPCYLEMLFQGNDANRTLQSWGPDAKLATDGAGNYIAFHPEVGGYINADWSLIPDSHDNNYEALLGAAWIRACDTFKTTLWSNMNYKYSVSIPDGGLVKGSEVLPVEMRYAKFDTTSADKNLADVIASDWSANQSFSAPVVILNGGNVLKENTVFQQFRVPFSKEYSAGHYTGSITFTAATI